MDPDVSVKNVPDAKLKRPTDVLVKIRTTNYLRLGPSHERGRTNMEAGRVLGHENLGQGYRDWRCRRSSQGGRLGFLSILRVGFVKIAKEDLLGFVLRRTRAMPGQLMQHKERVG
jgi:glutathione-independent formaldehyde dehydrogenase